MKLKLNKVYRLIFSKKILSLVFPFISILAALVIGGVIMSLSGANPILAYQSMLKGSIGDAYAITDTIRGMIPLVFTGLAVAFASRTGVFNIGAEGQLYMGALASAITALFLELPSFLLILVSIIAGILGGAIWALIAVLLREKRNVNIVISTLMLNYLAVTFVHFMVNGPIKAKNSLQVATEQLPESAFIPYLIPRPYGVTYAIIIIFLVITVLYLLLNYTSLGFKIRAVGENKKAAEVAGIKVDILVVLSLVISGGLAGLGGTLEILGNQHRLVSGFSSGYGYTGIPISLLARSNPIGVLFSAFFFSVLRTGSISMQATAGVSSNVTDIIQGLVIVFIAAEFMFKYWLKLSKDKIGKLRGVGK